MEISRNGWNNSDSLKQRGLRPDLRLRRVTGDHPAFEKITSADRHAATMRVKGKFIPIKSLPESRRGKISVTFTVKWKKPSIVLNPMCVCVCKCVNSHLALFVCDPVHMSVCVVTLYACNVCVGPRASLSVLLVMCVLPAGSVCTRLRLEPRGGPDNTISVEPQPRGSIQRGG